MPLPKITAPTYELVLPSSDRKIRYRPFLVKEEKLLIIAMESEDTKQITEAVKNVLKNCILTRGIKVEKLATFDIEFLFLINTYCSPPTLRVHFQQHTDSPLLIINRFRFSTYCSPTTWRASPANLMTSPPYLSMPSIRSEKYEFTYL